MTWRFGARPTAKAYLRLPRFKACGPTRHHEIVRLSKGTEKHEQEQDGLVTREETTMSRCRLVALRDASGSSALYEGKGQQEWS